MDRSTEDGALVNRRSTFVRRPHRVARALCLFNAHRWGRLTVFTIFGVKVMYERCDWCEHMRPAVLS
jgi:hypothetical protein